MATAKKSAPKAAAIPKKVTTPVKVAKPVVKATGKKAPVSKTAKVIAKISASIAKLTERKDKIFAEIKALRDQRATLKAVSVTAVPVAPNAKAAPRLQCQRRRQSLPPRSNILWQHFCFAEKTLRGLFFRCARQGAPTWRRKSFTRPSGGRVKRADNYLFCFLCCSRRRPVPNTVVQLLSS